MVLIRGDVNNDELINVIDVQYLINHILGKPGGPWITSEYINYIADVNNDELINVIDVQYIINHILGKPGGPWISTSSQDPTYQTIIRTFEPPEKGILFSTRFYSDASLNPTNDQIRFDPSNVISGATSQYWYNKVVDLSNASKFADPENDKGITVVTVQIVSTSEFTDYLGAYTLQFSNWDFSANDPTDPSGVGTNGVNIFKKTDAVDWDPSAQMLVGIPIDYIQGTSDLSLVNFPVAITSSNDPAFNTLSHTNASTTSFIDLYTVFGKPILENVLNAYDQDLNQISSTDISWVSL